MKSLKIKRPAGRKRRGATLVIFVLLLVGFIGFVALVVDVGYLANTRAELQCTADAASMAACWDYIEQTAAGKSQDTCESVARASAISIAQENQVCKSGSTVVDADITIGYLADLTNRTAPLDTSDPDRFNAIRVVTQKTATQNGRVPFFFARVFGMDGTDAFASSTAAFITGIRGFRIPNDGSNLGFLPLALDEETWNAMLAGYATDTWKWNPETDTVELGADGVLEVNLYPQDTGAPGNRGTVDIGSSGNSTSDIARQIMHGVSPEDLAYHGGKLEFDEHGELFLNGDTGISAGIKDELVSIIGDPRVIPVYREVHGPGNNAMYTIVKFVGIRVLDVRLTGSKSGKRVIVQPAAVALPGVIPVTESSQASDFVYSNVFLCQ